MISRLLKTCLAGAALAVATLVGAASAEAQTRIVLSNDNNALGVKGQTFELLKKELETRLGSMVKVGLHHSGSLFDQATQIQGLQLGSAHLIAPGQGIYAPIAPKINALSLPFLLSTADAVQEVTRDPALREAIFSDLEKRNIVPVAIWINGPRDFSYRTAKPILLPQDMKGIKIRVQSTPLDIKTMESFGANAVGMTWTEVPTALQQGVIDAVEPVPNALVGASLHEIIRQTSRVNWQYNFYIVGANKPWFEGLSPDVKAGFTQALEVATKWNWENTEKENTAAYDKVRAAGKPIHEITPEQRAEWVKAVQPIWKEFGEKLVGADTLARILAIENKHANKTK